MMPIWFSKLYNQFSDNGMIYHRRRGAIATNADLLSFLSLRRYLKFESNYTNLHKMKKPANVVCAMLVISSRIQVLKYIHIPQRDWVWRLTEEILKQFKTQLLNQQWPKAASASLASAWWPFIDNEQQVPSDESSDIRSLRRFKARFIDVLVTYWTKVP